MKGTLSDGVIEGALLAGMLYNLGNLIKVKYLKDEFKQVLETMY
jgi:hypothetical protein